jgi:hypothetical protein
VNRFDVSVVVHHQEARRQLPGRARPRSPEGLDFDPLTGEPTAWSLPEPAIVTWYEEATAYAVMKWSSLAAHSRASLAEALATVTPVLTRPGACDRPDPRELRTALSLWLNSGGDPAQIAARAGHSVAILLTVYSHCIHGRDDLLNQQIDHFLEPPAGRAPCPSVRRPAVCTDRATSPKGQRLNRSRNPAEKPAVAPTAMGATPSAMRP